MYAQLIILAFILLQTVISKAQTCTICSTCTMTIDSVYTGNISIGAFDVLCITPNGMINGNILMAGSSKLCNEGFILGNVTMTSSSDLCNAGVIDVDTLSIGGTLNNYGRLTIGNDFTIDGNAVFNSLCDLTVDGTLYITGGANYTLTGSITVGGDLYIQNGSDIMLTGVIDVTGDLYMDGTSVLNMSDSSYVEVNDIAEFKQNAEIIGGSTYYSQMIINGITNHSHNAEYLGKLDVCLTSSPGSPPAPATKLGPDVTLCVNNIPAIAPTNLCSPLVLCVKGVVSAGSNDTICEGNNYTIPSASVINDSIKGWNTSGDGTFNDTSLIKATYTPGVNDINNGSVVLKLTIIDTCGNTVSDSLTLFINATTTMANAGPNDTICNTSTTTLAGNTPSAGTGTWTTITGGGTVTTPSNPNSGVTGLSIGDNEFVWTINNSPCSSSSDTVLIVNSPTPTVADAGPNDTLCNTSTATLAGNTPSPGIGTWTVITGTGNVTSPNNPTSGVTGLSSGVNAFVWTITDPNNACPPTTDTVAIINSPTPTVADAGPNDTLCNTSTATLAGNTPSPGIGTWTVITGTGNVTSPNNPTSGVTGLSSGVNVFVWTITDLNNSCPATTDTVIIVNSPTPTIADAGNDQSICSSTTATLAGNTPTPGIGTWTVVAGTGNVTSPNNPTSGVTGLSTGTNMFVWTISDPNNACPATTDTIVVTNNPIPTVTPISPSECENVPGSKQALNVDVTALNNALNPSGTFTWYTNNTYTTTFVPNNETVDSGQVFYFEVMIAGCILRDSVIYSVSDNIILNDPFPEFCEDIVGSRTVSGIDLTNFNSGVFVGGSSYTWGKGPTNVTINNGDSINVQVQQGSCPVVDIYVHFTVNPLPTANPTTMELCDNGTGQAIFDLTTLNNSVNGNTGNIVNWFSDSMRLTPIIPENSYLTGSTIAYNIVFDTATGCADTSSTPLTVNPLNSISPDSIAPLCIGDPLILTASGSGTITWYSDSSGTMPIGNGSPFSPPYPGKGTHTYYVQGTGVCNSPIKSVTITINEVVALINATPTTGFKPLNVFFEPTHTYTDIGTYVASLIITDGICSDTSTITIDVVGKSEILIPNVFTPNGDGINDVFTVKGTNLESVEGEIYSRWGQLLFSWDNVQGTWDGRTPSGSEAPDGTYFYIIQAKGTDSEEYFKKGSFSLIR